MGGGGGTEGQLANEIAAGGGFQKGASNISPRTPLLTFISNFFCSLFLHVRNLFSLLRAFGHGFLLNLNKASEFNF